MTQANRITGQGVLAPVVAPAHRTDPIVAQHLQWLDATMQRHAMGAQPGHVIHTARQQAGRGHQTRQSSHLVGQRGSVQHGGHAGAGFGVLVGHQVQQRPRADKHHAVPDGAALVLEGHLRATQGEDAGQGPAGKRQDPVGGAGAQNQLGVRLGRGLTLLGLKRVEQVQLPVLGIPGQGVAEVLNMGQQAGHGVVQRGRARGVAAIQRLLAPLKMRWRLAVDLPARTRRFIDQHRPEAMPHQGLGGPDAGRASADDHHLPLSCHAAPQAGCTNACRPPERWCRRAAVRRFRSASSSPGRPPSGKSRHVVRR